MEESCLPSSLSVHSQKLDIGHPVHVIKFENVRTIGVFFVRDLIDHLTAWYAADGAVTMLV